MNLCRPNDGISCIDPPEKHNHRWFVRITLKGEINSQFFADTSHRGKQAALTEARRHRDTLVKKLPQPRLETLAFILSCVCPIAHSSPRRPSRHRPVEDF
jgi:hypothetical protein